MPVYNKLVRDLIPQIIERSGKSCSTRTLTDDEWLAELKVKFQEEWAEYIAARRPNDQVEELADLLEIILTLAQAAGASQEELLRAASEKKETRGGFDQKLFLIEVHDGQ